MFALGFEVILIAVQLVLLAWAAWFAWYTFTWVTSEWLDVPFVPTPMRYAGTIAEALSIGQGDVVYELGSGDGRIVLALAMLHPDAKIIGVERNPFLYIYARWCNYRLGTMPNVEFRRGNLFDTDVTNADKIYAYLLHSVMQRLRPKFEREFKGRLASRAFPFAQKELSNVVELTDRIGAHGQHLLFVYDFE